MGKKWIIYVIAAMVFLFVSVGLFIRLNKPRGPEIVANQGVIKQGSSFYKLLVEEGLSLNEVHQITTVLSKHVASNKVKPGQKYIVEKTTSGVFAAFKYFPSEIEMYKIYLSTTGIYEVAYEKEELVRDIIRIEGEITSSLYNAMLSQEFGSAALAVEFADIFAWQIDFFVDPRKGDTFRFLCERFSAKTGYSRCGRILAAEYKTKKETYLAFFYESPEGKFGYYDSKGRAMRKAFLRSPLNYRRISSYFSRRRFHPILRYYRPHLGVDYAAPRGTPVVSVGDGRVIFVGRNGGYGKQIKIRHNSVYETWYAHLSRYAKAIKRGAKVRQGQVIGYVGSTGMSTGPHLDFRVKKNGRMVNYLRLKFPPASSVKRKYMADFKAKRDELNTKL